MSAHGQGRMVDTVGVVVDVLVTDPAGEWVPLDLCDVLDMLELRTGRDSAASPVCEPNALTVQIIDPDGSASRLVALRRGVLVNVSAAAAAYWGLARAPRLFLGLVTQVTIRSDAQLGAVLTLIASSAMSDLGRTYVGDVPWSQEPATTRAVRVLETVGYDVTLYPGPFDPAVLPRDVDRTAALDLVGDLAVEALFAVTDDPGDDARWSTLDPALTWAAVPASVSWAHVDDYLDQPVALASPHALIVASSWRDAWAAAHAAGPAGADAFTVSACELLADWAADYSLAGMVNRIAIRYGVAAEGGEQPETVYVDQVSVDAYGLLEESLTTDLATKADADAMAGHLFATAAVAKPSLPLFGLDLWRTATKVTGTGFLSGAQRALVSWWRVPDLPAVMPVNRYGYLWLEGVHHTITSSSWHIDAAVSDPWPYGNEWLWVELPAGLSWAELPAGLSWAEVNTFVPTSREAALSWAQHQA